MYKKDEISLTNPLFTDFYFCFAFNLSLNLFLELDDCGTKRVVD
jgi:hypothetical protein